MPVKKYSSKEEAKKAKKEQTRLWRLKNKDRIKSKVKEYQQKNIEQVKKAKREWAKRNRVHIKEYSKNYQTLTEYKKKWRINNRDKSKAHNLKYLKTEKGQITHLWDNLRNRIKIYTFSKRKSSRNI